MNVDFGYEKNKTFCPIMSLKTDVWLDFYFVAPTTFQLFREQQKKRFKSKFIESNICRTVLTFRYLFNSLWYNLSSKSSSKGKFRKVQFRELDFQFFNSIVSHVLIRYCINWNARTMLARQRWAKKNQNRFKEAANAWNIFITKIHR